MAPRTGFEPVIPDRQSGVIGRLHQQGVITGAEGFEPSNHGFKNRCVANFTTPLLCNLERATGFEPVFQAWKACTLPFELYSPGANCGRLTAVSVRQDCALPLNEICMVERIGIEPMTLRAST